MKEIRGRESSLKGQNDSIEPQLANVPTEQQIQRKAKSIQQIVGQIYRIPSRLAKMTFEERRELVSVFFSGKDAQGRRLGVYVEKDPDGSIRYEIRGTFRQPFKMTLTPDSPDILDLRDMCIDYLEELKEVVRGKGDKLDFFSRDKRRND